MVYSFIPVVKHFENARTRVGNRVGLRARSKKITKSANPGNKMRNYFTKLFFQNIGKNINLYLLERKRKNIKLFHPPKYYFV